MVMFELLHAIHQHDISMKTPLFLQPGPAPQMKLPHNGLHSRWVAHKYWADAKPQTEVMCNYEYAI